jgi:ferredoxin
MPGNYVIGFDVKSSEKQKETLQDAEKRIAEINETLTRRRKANYQLIKGDKAVLRTALVAPIFNAFALSTKKFYTTDACTRCKLCEKICPVHTITVNEKPSWGKNCTQCLACINRCPVRAIQYGKNTINRGRYVHPDLR